MSRGGLMIMAGGTGGHVFPALAVAQHLQSRGVTVRWMGTRRGLEARVVPAANIPIDWISIEGLRGTHRLSLVFAPFKLVRAMWQAARLLRRHKPEVVLGMGGFVAGPGGLVTRMLGLPLVIHEQNAIAGLTNRYLAKIANKVLTGFPNVPDLPLSSVWVGNPVRDGIGQSGARKADFQPTEPADRGALSSQLNVLVIGGSQGAQSFNRYLPACFAQLAAQVCAPQSIRLRVWHQTGRGRSEAVQASYVACAAHADIEPRVSEFIDDMAQALAWADLVVCRAGAMTIAELCAAAIPSIVVPYPFSAGDHQEHNAHFLVDAGAAVMVSDTALAEGQLLSVFTDLLAMPARLQQMRRNAQRLHKPQALADVAAACEEFIDA